MIEPTKTRFFVLDGENGTRIAVEQFPDSTFRVFLGTRDGGDERPTFATLRTADGRVGTAFRLSAEGAFMLWTCLENLLGQNMPPQG